MYDELFLIGIAVLAFPIAVIYLLFSHFALKRRVTELEDRWARRAQPQQPSQAIDTQPIETRTPSAPPSQKAPPADRPPVFASAPPQAAPPPAATNEALVFNSNNFDALFAWLGKNWFYAVSAVSLALAGIFMVQYSIEQGLLPPKVRIAAALSMGAALIGLGEFIRRRFGDGEESSTAYLPSTFSSAGVVTLFGAVFAARALYGLIGPEVALGGMALVGILAMVLGWFYGPLLAAVGVIGAIAAPFVSGGSSPDPSGLLAYFAIVTLAGLAIDTVRRWAWVSVLSLGLGFGAATLLMLGYPSVQMGLGFIGFCGLLSVAAIAIPVRQLVPTHPAPTLFLSRFMGTHEGAWPDFPVRVAAGALLASSALILLLIAATEHSEVFWAGAGVLTGLIIALLIWARGAPGLADLVLLPALALFGTIPVSEGVWVNGVRAWAMPDGTMPLSTSILVGTGLTISLIAAWRSLRGGEDRHFFAAFAALFAPVMAIAIEVFWQPGDSFASYGWALHAIIIAIVMMVMAQRFDKADGAADRLRVSLAVLSSIASLAFASVIVFSSAALTIALAVTIAAAAALDRKFTLPPMSVYIVVGVTATMYRLVGDPGLEWAKDAPLLEMLLSHGGAVLAFAASWYLMRGWNRRYAEVVLDSALFAAGGILISLLLYRAIVHWNGYAALNSHWAYGLGAAIWIVLGMAQLRRLEVGGTLASVRKALGGAFIALGGVSLLGAVGAANPLFTVSDGLVLGPVLANTLIPAYLFPAAILAAGARWLSHLPNKVRIAFLAVGGALAALWLGLTIRHFWRGGAEMVLPGVQQGELYSYTVVLLIIGAAGLYKSIVSRNAVIRKIGLTVIGLAVAKVFLVDISGLGGLTRVFSLLFLGLSLAGLAWLNRWAETKSNEADGSDASL